ncbi:acetyl-CoA carboxylase biotin carboxyl carrier protein [Helicobacter trogontum]|uniref:acetyl-CoA carboxylase biotin carboxyl carrier protein n=1 Tax=Helicobacter trogontum TaxID=50960 RepID=UPI00389A06D8
MFEGFHMKLSEIKELIQLFNNSDLASLRLEQENFLLKLNKEGKKVKVDKAAQVTPVQKTETTSATQTIESSPKPANANNADFITSPMVGTFYRSPSPGAAPYVSVGDTVKKGQTIGIVEAMKIMNEIEAEFDCKIVEIEVNDAQPVEYGTKLVMVERI